MTGSLRGLIEEITVDAHVTRTIASSGWALQGSNL
jgi:hypothetical protein